MDLDVPMVVDDTELLKDLHDITNTRRSAIRDSVFRPELPDNFRSSVRNSPPTNKPWDKPMDYTAMAAAPPPVSDDDDEEAFDVPDRLTMGPGAAAARLDLQRCTIRVHKQLVDQIKTNSMKPNNVRKKNDVPDELLRCQGELWLKSRLPMLGWKKRYGSIVDHAYFGPVLFMFKYDAKGNVALRHSMMIVLVDSDVRLGRNSVTKDRDYRCEFVLNTTKRRYTLAANHTMRRDYWLRNLETIQQQASTSYHQ